MSATGYIQLRAYTSFAQIPLKDVAVVITTEDGTAIAMRMTNRNGVIPAIEIPVPDRSESQEPGAAEPPFTTVTLHAYRKGYEYVTAKGLQVFAGTTTYQDLEMIPLSEFPDFTTERIHYQTPPQDL